MKYLITGGAGFIGSNLAIKLSKNNKVTIVDNLSTGFSQYIPKNQNIRFVKCDLLNLTKLKKTFKGHEAVFHLAANADIRFGLKNPSKDLKQNAIATLNVLEAMRSNNIKKILFTSTAPVYGKNTIFPTPEDAKMSYQTSLYGASKLYCEGLISSYCEGFDFQAWIFRFVSILGPRYSHGHVYDFLKMLLKNKKKLKVLGDGKQKKSYLHVSDCINAMMIAFKKSKKSVNIFNLGHDKYINVNKSINTIEKFLKIKPKKFYTGGKSGWIGDLPFVYLNNNKMKKLGWKPDISIEKSIKDTIKWLLDNKWIFSKRK